MRLFKVRFSIKTWKVFSVKPVDKFLFVGISSQIDFTISCLLLPLQGQLVLHVI